MRTASSVFAAMLLVAAPVIPAGNERASYLTTHAADLNPGGRVDIEGSFGELHVAGWDQPRIEVVVQRKTQKDYDPARIAKAEEMLRQVVVDIEERQPGYMVITTRFPDRNVFTRPLKGKSNLDLSYEIRLPRDTALRIAHDIGDVRIDEMSGDVNATCHIGEIKINVPVDLSVEVDAKARIGNVDSRITSDPPGQADRKLYARVGVGDIQIRPAMQITEDDEVRPLEVEII
jgi:hypothetical protein